MNQKDKWNPKGVVDFEDVMVYSTPRTYLRGGRYMPTYPTSEKGYPRYRNDRQFLRRKRDVYYEKDIYRGRSQSGGPYSGAASIHRSFTPSIKGDDLYYFRYVVPPTYYQLWDYQAELADIYDPLSNSY